MENPSIRKIAYGIAGALALAFVAWGIFTADQSARWMPVVQAGIGIVITVAGAIKVKRLDYKLLYVGLLALNAALGGAAVFTDDMVEAHNQILSQLSLLVPAGILFVRTNVADPQGVPAAEGGATSTAAEAGALTQ